MAIRGLYIALPVLRAAGLAILLSACQFAMASTPPTAPPTAQPSAPPPVAAPTPDLQPTVEAVVRQHMAEILAPSPRPDAGPPGHSDAAPADPPVSEWPQIVSPPPTGEYQPQYYRSGFTCTGSMRPAIDCGDEGVFLKPPFQEPLVVGDVISFSVDAGCRYHRDHDVSKAHRIVSVRVQDGTGYFTTQGDSVPAPDSCEVTLEHIDGKLVELRKGVRPQDIIDTSEYDYARERVRQLKKQYEVQRADLDRRMTDFAALGEEYRLREARYYQGTIEYQELVEFHRQLEEERVALGLLMDELNALGDDINQAIDRVDRIYRALFMR